MCLAGLGIYFNFQFERHSFVSTNDLQFAFLEHAALPIFGLGLLVYLIGGAIWVRRASARTLLIVGLSLVILAGSNADFVHINVDTWTGCLMFLYGAGVLAGVFFVIVGLLRRGSQNG